MKTRNEEIETIEQVIYHKTLVPFQSPGGTKGARVVVDVRISRTRERTTSTATLDMLDHLYQGVVAHPVHVLHHHTHVPGSENNINTTCVTTNNTLPLRPIIMLLILIRE